MERAPEYDLSDPPLMSRPMLMLMALRQTARRGPSTMAALAGRLRAARERIGDPVRVSPAELDRRLAVAVEYLARAGLLETADGGRLTITERGRRVLADHPAGIDGSVLSEFPEFRAFIHERAEQAARTAENAAPSPHPMPSPAYQEGYEAHMTGHAASDNPYDEETIDHLAWANGWFEARDEAQEHGAA